MLFSLMCIDKADGAALRAATRPAHVDYLKSAGDKIVFAGAMTDETGETVVGSNFLLSVADQAEAEAFAAGDPYAQEGVFGSVTLRPTRKAIWNPDKIDE